MSSVLRKDLRTSTAEGMAASVMVGMGETYLPVFVLALSGSQVACGLVSTVPLVIGAVIQPTPKGSCAGIRINERKFSRKGAKPQRNRKNRLGSASAFKRDYPPLLVPLRLSAFA